MKNTLKLAGITTDLRRVSGDINRTGTTFLIIAWALALGIIVLACTPKKGGTETTQYDYSKILKGDLSDFAGTWVNGNGTVIELKASGSFSVVEYDLNSGPSENFRVSENSAYVWSSGHFSVRFYPIGVEISEYSFLQTDTTRERMLIIQHDGPGSNDDVYYFESGTTTAQPPTADTPKVMYVNSVEGLRVRNTPNINGERIGLLPHLAAVMVISEDADDVTIDNIKGKWVSIQYRTRISMAYGTQPLDGWVFSGYLMNWSDDNYQNHLDNMDFKVYFQAANAQKITGNWSPGNDWYRYNFISNGEYSYSLLETSYSASGTWQIKDNELHLSEIERGDYEPEVHDPPLSYVYQFIVIGSDTLLLRSVNQEDESTQIFFRAD